DRGSGGELRQVGEPRRGGDDPETRGAVRRHGRGRTSMSECRSFRFGVHTSDAPDGAAWAAAARRYETLGFSSLLVRDHFDDQLAPIVAMTAALCATTTLRVGCL